MAALFDSIAEAYDTWYETPLGRKVEQLEQNLLFRMASPQPGARALDAGCGTGRITAALARRGLEVTGVDVSGGMLRQARQRTQAFDNVTLLQADLEKLPFPGASFDLVVAFTVLEFTADPGAVVRELWRLVKPGGRLVIGVLNAWSPWAWQRRRKARRGPTVFAHARFFSPPELRSLLLGQTGEDHLRWDTSVYIPPWSGPLLISLAAPLERAARPVLRPFGAVIVGRVDKRKLIRPVFDFPEIGRLPIPVVQPRETRAVQTE